MPTKVRELDNSRDGERLSCPICNPSKRLVREDQVWAFAQANPGVEVWRG